MSTSNARVKWAERKDKLYVTVEVVDAIHAHVAFNETTVTIAGHGIVQTGVGPIDFTVSLNLLHEIQPAESSYKTIGHSIQVLMMKKDSGPYWGKLTTDPNRQVKHWISCDWSLYKDEDDAGTSEPAPGDFGGYGNMDHLNMGGPPPPGGEMDSDDDEPPEPEMPDEEDDDDRPPLEDEQDIHIPQDTHGEAATAKLEDLDDD